MGKNGTGRFEKPLQKEESIYNVLKAMIGTDTKVYYVMWLYCPEFLKDYEKRPIKTFEDLKDRYAVFKNSNMKEEVCKRYLLENNVQVAVKWLLKRLHQKKLIELYNTYYNKALSGDVQSFKAFLDFSDKYFTEDKENGLTKLLQKIPDAELNDDEDYAYEYTED